MQFNEKEINTETIYKGSLIDVEKMTVQLPDNELTQREIVRHPGGAMVIPIIDDSVIMVKQFRKPLNKVSFELPAGKLDANEQPIKCATRELEEETGYKAEKIEHIMSVDTTPGFSDEIIYIYIATNLRKGILNPDKDEFLEVEKVKIKDLINLIYKGEITDAKTVIGAFIAEKHIM